MESMTTTQKFKGWSDNPVITNFNLIFRPSKRVFVCQATIFGTLFYIASIYYINIMILIYHTVPKINRSFKFPGKYFNSESGQKTVRKLEHYILFGICSI